MYAPSFAARVSLSCRVFSVWQDVDFVNILDRRNRLYGSGDFTLKGTKQQKRVLSAYANTSTTLYFSL